MDRAYRHRHTQQKRHKSLVSKAAELLSARIYCSSARLWEARVPRRYSCSAAYDTARPLRGAETKHGDDKCRVAASDRSSDRVNRRDRAAGTRVSRRRRPQQSALREAQELESFLSNSKWKREFAKSCEQYSGIEFIRASRVRLWRRRLRRGLVWASHVRSRDRRRAIAPPARTSRLPIG